MAVAATGTAVLALAAAGCGTQSGAGASMPAPTFSRQYGVHADTLPPDTSGGNGFESYDAVPPVRPGVTVSPTAACAGPGPRVGGGVVSGAMGLRQSDITLTNCGTKSLAVSGYPKLRLVDDRGRTVDVRVHHGDDFTDDVIDPGPAALTLRPGQQAIAVLAWRNTYTESDEPPVQGAAVEITVAGGKQRVPIDVDLGNTGKLDVTAWHRPK